MHPAARQGKPLRHFPGWQREAHCLYPGVIRVSVQYGSHVWSELLMPNDEGNNRVVRVDFTQGSTSRLVVQERAEEATMNRQPASVVDKAQLLEFVLVHEMTVPRPGCARHSRPVFLIELGKDNLGSIFLAKMSQQKENPGQTLLTGIEKLIDEILPNAFDACPGLFHILSLDLQLQRS